jgi:prepilin peptidase CpaA
MAVQLQVATSIGFAVLMALAAVEDFRRLVIPNRLVLGLLSLWPIHQAAAPAVARFAALESVGGALLVFTCGALLFSRGWIGGGDVKLLTAAALWAGIARLSTLLLLTGLLGGALALFCLTPVGARVGTRTVEAPPGGISAGTRLVPYGAAIAGAALITVLPSQWS